MTAVPDTHWRWPNFDRSELLCTHCGEFATHPESLDKLQALRTRYGKPLAVTSAYRCARHPIEAKKVAPGAHATGRAFDLRAIGSEAYQIIRLAYEVGFTGIGVSQRGGQPRFIHLDDCPVGMDSGIVRPMVWGY